MNVSEEKLKLGKYYHTAGSFHVYETHWKMMKKINENYRENCQNKGYPSLNKYILKDKILSNHIPKYCLPDYNMSKEEIQNHTQTVKREIYE